MILNLTRHNVTQEQFEQGVREAASREAIHGMLTFQKLPTSKEVADRAESLAAIAFEEGAKAALIGGASYLMPRLEEALISRGIRPLYSWTRRECEERLQPDGMVKKVFYFLHEGFVDVCEAGEEQHQRVSDR